MVQKICNIYYYLPKINHLRDREYENINKVYLFELGNGEEIIIDYFKKCKIFFFT